VVVRHRRAARLPGWHQRYPSRRVESSPTPSCVGWASQPHAAALDDLGLDQVLATGFPSVVPRAGLAGHRIAYMPSKLARPRAGNVGSPEGAEHILRGAAVRAGAQIRYATR